MGEAAAVGMAEEAYSRRIGPSQGTRLLLLLAALAATIPLICSRSLMATLPSIRWVPTPTTTHSRALQPLHMPLLRQGRRRAFLAKSAGCSRRSPALSSGRKRSIITPRRLPPLLPPPLLLLQQQTTTTAKKMAWASVAAHQRIRRHQPRRLPPIITPIITGESKIERDATTADEYFDY